MAIRRLLTVLTTVLIAAGFALLPTRSASAATFTVTTTDDTTDGTCDATHCSLREAIAAANAAAGADTIVFATSANGTITLTSVNGPLAISSPMTIDGNGAASTIVSGGGAVRVFNVAPGFGAAVTLQDLTVANGYTLANNGSGAGLYLFNGNLTIRTSTFSSNFSPSGCCGGGAIWTDGALTVINSTFINNGSSNSGAAIYKSSFGSVPFIVGSTFTNNSGNGVLFGGATVLNSTFTDHLGSIASFNSSSFTNSTFYNNPGGINPGFSGASVNNSILVNTSCSNVSGSANLTTSNTCPGTVVTAAEINLQALANNGGPTQTMALGAGSVAANAGNNSLLPQDTGDVNGNANTTERYPFDQRGFTRIVGGIVDVGAFESDILPPSVTITSTGGSTAVTEDGATDSYQIVLGSPPASDVNAEIVFDPAEVTLTIDATTFTTSPAQLTFTPANWDTPQTITVAAVNDRALEGNHTAALVHSFSGPANYTGIVASIDGTDTNTLTVSLTDNESGVIGWAAPTSNAAEGQTNQPAIQLAITTNPTGGTPTLEGSIGLRVTPTLTTAEAADIGGNTTGIFPVTALSQPYAVNHLDDTLIEGEEDYTLTLELTGLTAGMNLTTATLTHTATIVDADSATLTLSAGTSVSEAGGTHPVIITLNTATGNTLENPYTAQLNLLNDTAVYNGATGDMFFTGPANTTTITFPTGTANLAMQIADVQIVSDRTVEASTLSSTGFNTPERFSVQLGAISGAINAVMVAAPVTRSVTIDEDDFAYVTMNPTFVVSDVNDLESVTARTTTVQVRIVATGTGTAQVQDAFTVPVSTSGLGNTNDATLTADYTLTTTSVTFPAGALDNAQLTVAFTVNDDAIDEFYGALNAFNQNREFFDIGFSDSAVRATYAGVPILLPNTVNDDCNGTSGRPNLPGACRSRSTIIILDNDTANVNVNESGGNTAVVEGGAGDSYDVVLATQPTSNVTVNLSFDPAQVTVNGDTDGAASLIFTPITWSAPQTVTVFAVNDTVFEANPHTSLITQTITSTDLIYNAINPADVTVSITDNDTARIVFATPSGSFNETSGSANATARLDLVTNGSPGGTLPSAANVPITLTLDAAEAGDLTLITTSVTFPPGSGNGATQPINVTLVNDLLLEGTQTATLGFGTPSGPATASGTFGLTINDDESGAITFNTSTSTAPEGTTPHTVGVSLTIAGTGTGDLQLESAASVGIIDTPGTASTPADYSLTTPSVTFSAGTTSPIAGTIESAIVNDALTEIPDETFNLSFGTVTSSAAITPAGSHTVTITDNDPAGLIFAPVGGVTVTEDFALLNNASYTVRLANQPTSPVVLTLSFDSTFVAIPDGTPQGIQINGLGTGAVTLNFTSANWDQPQTLTVRAYEDFVNETPDPQPFTITHQPSGNPAYAALTGAAITYTVNVNDGITNNPNAFNLLTPADGVLIGPGTLPAALNTLTWQDPVNAVTFNLAVTRTAPTSGTALTLNNLTRASDADDLSCDGTTCTLSLDATAQATLTPGAYSWTVTAVSPLGNTPAAAPFTFTIGSIVTVSPAALPLSEGGANGLPTVVLAGQPAGTVTFDVTTSGSGFTVSPPTVTFDGTNFATPQTITVVPTDDPTVDGTETGTITFTPTSAGYFDLSAATIDVTVTDNDSAEAVLIIPIGGTAALNESGGTHIYTYRLLTRPQTDVVILVSSGDTTEATIIPAELTFTPTNWDQPQPVTINSVDDTVVDGTQRVTFTFSVDPARSDDLFDALNPIASSINVLDNDAAGFTVTPTDGSTSVSESGTTDTVTVVLTTAPLTDVVIAVSSGDTTEANIGPAELIFTPTNWSQPQAVTVTGVDDTADDGDQTSTLTFSVNDARSDAAFAALADQTVSVTTVDNDDPPPVTPEVTPIVTPVVTPEVTPIVTPVVTPPTAVPTAIPTLAPTPIPPPDTPLCEAHNFAPGGVVRTGIPDAIRHAVNCRVLYQNGSPVTWNGGELYSLANVGVPLSNIQQAIDVFSPPPSSLTSFASSLFCLRGTGTLVWLAAANAPRVPVPLTGVVVSAFPGFTCVTLTAPGTLVLTSP